MTAGPSVGPAIHMFPVSIDEYRAELYRAVESLRPDASRVAVRGDDAASFVIAESDRGSVEIARDEDYWCLDFWMPEDEESCAQRKVADWRAVVGAARRFLQSGEVAQE